MTETIAAAGVLTVGLLILSWADLGKRKVPGLVGISLAGMGLATLLAKYTQLLMTWS
jgi:hypothetical protein